MGRAGESPKSAVLKVAYAAFEGIAPLLIEQGITSPEAEALLRAVCVRAAAKTQKTRGKRPNVSRISIKTGIDRHTVAELLRAAPEGEAGFTSRRDSMSRVIEGWLSDPEYTERGQPRDLDIGDPGFKGRSIWSLVKRYAPGVWPRLIIDELIRVDCVETLPNGQLRWKSTQVSKGISKRVTRGVFGQRMHDAMRSLFRDMTHTDTYHKWRSAQSSEIAVEDLPLIRKMLRDRLDSMFAWMTDELNSARWRRDGITSDPRVRVGLCGFTFEEPAPRDVGNDDGATKIRLSKRRF
jgi:hypothetical protein